MYREKTSCICCDKTDLVQILDLKNQPLANSYHKIGETLDTYPLKLNLCKHCYHLQLSHIVDPNLLFKNYLYVSGTTQTLRDYFDWFAKFVTEYEPTAQNVLDIACNDGSQLDSFSKLKFDTYGIDPAENLHSISSLKHNVICDYFDASHFNKKFDIIVAQNVFAHNENAKKFLDDCTKIMHNDSLLFIQTSQAEMVEQNQFDTIYHEHLSFFNINSFNELVKRTELNLVDVIKTPIHGTSYVFILSRTKSRKQHIHNQIELERSKQLLSLSRYNVYQTKVKGLVHDFKNKVDSFRKNGYEIVGYGAAAKGNTFLNFAEVKLDCIIDDNPLKQGLLTPGMDIPIVSIDTLKQYSEENKILFVPLAWNFHDEIVKRIRSVRSNPLDCYMKYFPEIEVKQS